jgi:hypothetical protein
VGHLLVAAALLLFSVPVLAHPGIGIVVDSKDNIYYTDLGQVWRIGPDGTKSVVVPNVHTHELFIDARDNLFGEHLWYEGDRTRKWRHFVWKRAPDGRVTRVVPAREGFLQNYSFVRDGRGTMYWPDRERSLIRKKSADGVVSVHASASFRDIRWMAATANGTLYVIDRTDLLRIDPAGRVQTLARDLSRPRRFLPPGDRHALFGIWTDRAGNAYVADYAEREVHRIDLYGRVSIVAESTLPWGPTGGVFDRGGNLWLLEYSLTNQVRVRKVGSTGR